MALLTPSPSHHQTSSAQTNLSIPNQTSNPIPKWQPHQQPAKSSEKWQRDAKKQQVHSNLPLPIFHTPLRLQPIQTTHLTTPPENAQEPFCLTETCTEEINDSNKLHRCTGAELETPHWLCRICLDRKTNDSKVVHQ